MTKVDCHMTLEHDLLKDAEKLGKSRSDAVEKGLRLLIAEHKHPIDKKPDAKGASTTKAANAVIIRMSQRITENKNTIEFLATKAEYLSNKVGDTPGIIKRLKMIEEELKDSYKNIFIAVDPLKTDIKSLTERVKEIEDEKERERLELKPTPVDYPVFNQLSRKVDSLERQFKTHRGLSKEEAESMKWIP